MEPESPDPNLPPHMAEEDFRRRIGGPEKSIQSIPVDLATACQRVREKMAARTAADRARHHLAAIVDSAEDAIISKDLDGVIRSWNPGAERLFGFSAVEMIGTSVSRLLTAERQDEEALILARLRRGDRISHYETVRVRKDGQTIPVSLTISPVRDDHGTIIGASKIAHDLTDQKQFEARANLVAQLQRALAEIKTLRGLVPMCAWCKKIRDDDGYWQNLESYLQQHTEAEVSHGICPDCQLGALAELNSFKDGHHGNLSVPSAGPDAKSGR